VDVVLLDATDPWAGGELLPAGRLREPRESLRRAHVVIVTRAREAGADRLRALAAELAELLPGVPLFQADAQVLGLRPVGRGEPLATAGLAGHRVFALAGIARPDAFFACLENAGAILVGRQSFPDHHAYRRAEVAALQRRAADLGATTLVTTEKDAVRLPVPARSQPPVAAVRSRIAIHREDRLLSFLLSKLPGPSRGGKPLG
jgi:tetraacyldisaccharide 4'-kinase